MADITYSLWRFSSQDNSTLGLLSRNHGQRRKTFRCFTLEDEFRAVKVPGETRIPAGTYEIKLRAAGGLHAKYQARYGALHKGMLHLQDVPGFEWIYIHVGNHDEHTEGCILVGDGATSNLPRVGRGAVTASANAYKALYEEMADALEAGDRVFLRIWNWNFG